MKEVGRRTPGYPFVRGAAAVLLLALLPTSVLAVERVLRTDSVDLPWAPSERTVTW